SPEVGCSKPARILSSVVLPEPLSPKMVRNSASAISSEMSRRTTFLPKCLATERMERSGPAAGLVAFEASDSMVVGMAVFYALLAFADRSVRATQIYWVAFTSFQISLYLARRGTFCQK